MCVSLRLRYQLYMLVYVSHSCIKCDVIKVSCATYVSISLSRYKRQRQRQDGEKQNNIRTHCLFTATMQKEKYETM